MRKLVPAVLALALSVAPAFAVDVQSTSSYLIKINGNPPANLSAQVAAAGGTLQRVHPEIGYAVATSADPNFSKNLHGSSIQGVDRDLSIQWVPSLHTESAGPAQQASTALSPASAFFYPCQWSLQKINAPAAWAQGATGAGIKVAVLDTGVDPFHQDLAGRIDVANSASMLTPGSSLCGAFDEANIYDLNFHGSFVSGLITSNNLGTAGVAPDAQVVGVKVLSCTGSGSFGDVIAGILYAANLADVDILNMSLGAAIPKNLQGAGPLIAAMNKAINYAQSQGKLVVSAAGNDGADMQHSGNVTWVPAESGSGIAVYATSNLDTLAAYSNYGVSGTWVGAPGGDFPNTSAGLPGCPVNDALESLIISVCSSFVCGGPNFYALGDGTSFASPITAGVAALVDGQHGGSLDAAQLKTILKNTADDLGKPGTDAIFSHGRVNAGNAVQQ
jgi:subtilisin family serine protease